MRPDAIEGHELLFRAVKPNPVFWKSIESRPSSALFKDSLGVSIDRDGEREEMKIISGFRNRFTDLRGIAKVKAQECLDLKCRTTPDPVAGNEFHGLILGEVETELSNRQARELAKKCDFLPI
jgi:hypothetical protein